ncbi:MAG: DUF4214 domain-containing protein [Pirellulales bacterium]
MTRSRRSLPPGCFLSFERLERREVLASVSGIKFADLTGDGFSPDDVPQGGVTIELFLDDGDGVFDPAGDLLLATDVTDAITGGYQFDNLATGRYFIREQVPAGSIQTGGPAFYTVDVLGDDAFSSGAPIDDFESPSPGETFFINAFNLDPTLLKHVTSGALGGERDVFIDVLGTANPISASGQVGFDGTGGFFTFATAAPGTMAVLEYDGVDADSPGPPASLINAEGLSADVTAGGTATGVRLDFETLEAGLLQTELDVEIRATGPGGAAATFTGAIPESIGPSIFFVPFSSFTTSGGFSFENISSLEFIFNSSGVPDVDFQLDFVGAAIAGPGGFNFANAAQLSALAGCVFVDANNNGVVDAGEAGLPGVTITLTGTDDLGNEVLLTTVTDSDGNFRFDNLRPGTYKLTETQPANFVDGQEVLGSLGGTVTNDMFSDIVLPAGIVGVDYCFGERGRGDVSKQDFFASAPPGSVFFVDALFRRVLGRPGSLEDIVSWSNTINAGVSMAQVADAFFDSVERKTGVIGDLYEQYLGRAADAEGLRHWIAVWDATGSLEQIQASIIASPEFFASSGGTDEAWVLALYQNLLGRSASSAEIGFWTNRLAAVDTRDIVLGFLFSDELRLASITSWYASDLDRPPDPGSAQFWLSQLRQGLTPDDVRVRLLVSAESLARFG